MRRVIGWLVAAAALAVIVGGLWPESSEADPAVREQQLSQRIACPWCDGQSLAESDSQVAQDLVVILREQIDEGWRSTTSSHRVTASMCCSTLR